MYKTVLAISIVIIFGLGAFLVYPVLKGRFQPMLSLAEIEAVYTQWLAENNLHDPIEDVNIVITKDNHGLYLMSGDELIERWDVALSLNPTGMPPDISRTRSAKRPKSSGVVRSLKVGGEMAGSPSVMPRTSAILPMFFDPGRCPPVPVFAPCPPLK